MFNSLSTALSSLNADATAIEVVGNNLANLNTTGFKASSVSFHDLVSQSLGSTPGDTQVGFGVSQPTTNRQFNQGALQTTSAPLDAAIQGQGLFVLQGSGGSTEYTRAGSFQMNRDGFLVSSSGEKLQGWTQTNGLLNTNAPPSSMQIAIGSLGAPVATKSMSFDLNLNAAATAGPPPDTFSASLPVYDSLGEAHVVTVNFTKSATAGKWDYAITAPASDLKSAFTPVTGSVTFDAQGKLATPLPTDPAPKIALTGLTDGAADLSVDWSLYNGSTPRLTQFAQPSAKSAEAQDGSPSTQLTSVGIGENGKVLAQYSNGQQLVVGQLAVALVRNPESLIAVGNNNFEVSSKSAAPSIGVPGTGGRGTVSGGALESSTVDIAREFTNLIVLQRGYQASTRIVTTVDELSQETINLKH